MEKEPTTESTNAQETGHPTGSSRSGRSRRRSHVEEKNEPSSISAVSSGFLRFLYFDPVQFVSGLWDTFDAWRTTRDWKNMRWVLPPFLMIAICGGAVVWGASKSDRAVLLQYLELAEKYDSQAAKKSPGDLKSEDETENPKSLAEEDDDKSDAQKARDAQTADLVYRRILQLESDNKRARYFVAVRQGQGGNLSQARTAMRALAPEDRKGYEEAHAWLASNLLQASAKGEKVDMEIVKHHLASASQGANVSGGLLMMYAGILFDENLTLINEANEQLVQAKRQASEEKALLSERKLQELDRKVEEILEIGKRAARIDERMQIDYARLCIKAKRPERAKSAAEVALRTFSPKLGLRSETDDDRIAVVNAHLMLGNENEALQTLQNAIVQNPNRPVMRRMLSDVLLMQYRKTIKKQGDSFQSNPALLNFAASIDPGNPRVGEEVAQLASIGSTADDKMLEVLNAQLANGNASAITHLLLANAYVHRKNLQKAMTHWELCLAQNPNMILALNNLAIALSQAEPPQFEKSLEMLDRASKILGPDAEILDSKGEVLMRAGKTKEAIASFEQSLSLNAKRINTRQQLAQAYRALGLEEQAVAQDNIITQLHENSSKP